MKEFNKSMLKDGDRLTLRNGDVYYYDNKDLVICGLFNENLNGVGNLKRYDIVKVERIQVDSYEVEQKYLDECLKLENIVDLVNNNLTYQTIWERETIEFEGIKKQPKKIEPMIIIKDIYDTDTIVERKNIVRFSYDNEAVGCGVDTVLQNHYIELMNGTRVFVSKKESERVLNEIVEVINENTRTGE